MIYRHALIPKYNRLLSALRGKRSWWTKNYVMSLAKEIANGGVVNPKRRKPRNHHRNRGFAVTEMAILDDETFKRMFRLDRGTFHELADDINPYIDRDASKAKNSSGSAIPTTTRLAVTLRWLAGGQQLDLCFAWGISKSVFFSNRGVLWPTIIAIDKVIKLGFPINDNDALEELAAGFREHSGGVLDNCVLAIDGMAVKTICPSVFDVRQRKDYRCRKGGFAIILMAGCDVRGKFFFATSNHSGSTNDIIAWNDSKLCDAINDNKLPPQYFFIGDEAFTNTQQFLSPWSGRGLPKYKDSFNYWLSHSRQCIERAFGMLTQRWGIFHRRFCFSFERWSLVTQVCLKLHNLCIDRNVSMPARKFHEDHVNGDRWTVFENNDEEEDIALRGNANGDRRRLITERLEREGIVRPPHAQHNSRMEA